MGYFNDNVDFKLKSENPFWILDMNSVKQFFIKNRFDT